MSTPQAHFISQGHRPIQNPPIFQSGFQTSSILLSSDTVFPPLWLYKTLLYYCLVSLKQTKPSLGYLMVIYVPVLPLSPEYKAP